MSYFLGLLPLGLLLLVAGIFIWRGLRLKPHGDRTRGTGGGAHGSPFGGGHNS